MSRWRASRTDMTLRRCCGGRRQSAGGARAPCACIRARSSRFTSAWANGSGRTATNARDAKVGNIAAPRPLAPTMGKAGFASFAVTIWARREFCLATATELVAGSNGEPRERLPGAAPSGAAEIRMTSSIAHAQAKKRKRFSRGRRAPDNTFGNYGECPEFATTMPPKRHGSGAQLASAGAASGKNGIAASNSEPSLRRKV